MKAVYPDRIHSIFFQGENGPQGTTGDVGFSLGKLSSLSLTWQEVQAPV